MTFSYNDALTANRDKVRLHLGDTKSDAGPRPDKRNFSNEEIDFILTEESARVNGAVAHLLEILANEWTAYALSERADTNSFDASKVADEYRKQAAFWRRKPGGQTEAEGSSGLIIVTRTDAWTSSGAEYS